MKVKTSDLVLIAMFTAIIAALSQIQVPMPTCVPATLQTFAIAFCGYFLGAKRGAAAVSAYILLGVVGVPIFAGFKGGFACLGSFTGGFIYGFLAMVVLCGLKVNGKPLKIVMGISGVAALHFFGVLHYALLTPNDFMRSFLLVSAPYLLKDFVSAVLGYFAALAVSRATKGIVKPRI
ncbi:MAG: biotin transporter BioY [Firmicutes bacterium]|nr:biotin transporter BioY [[Eubacterium] siraeum]MCM1488639.1 biotin transporter BioY [Bacillota bacterium]